MFIAQRKIIKMETFKELFKKKFLCCHDWELWKKITVEIDFEDIIMYIILNVKNVVSLKK